ncbi:MAG: polyhydroxybutyrate depolymerase [Chloroflexota bacterium]|jgi:polyhydroxybutyrate depolymerase|nr:polyhydroxybutyrate depolymerase [Chloroflexota bacterium]
MFTLVIVAGGVVTLRAWGATAVAQVHAAEATARRYVPVPVTSAVPASSPSVSPTPGTVATDMSVTVGPRTRTFRVIEPIHPPGGRLPALIFLHGRDAALDIEIARDGLTPYAADGRLILVYPVGIGRSWNAGSCCSVAQSMGLDDVSFIRAVMGIVKGMALVDPARVFIGGYSNGARMAYRVACEGKDGAAGYVIVGGLPAVNCQPSTAVSILQVANRTDRDVAYSGGTLPAAAAGIRRNSVLAQVDAVASFDGCASGPARTTTGALTIDSWTACRDGSRVDLATYPTSSHFLPVAVPGTPHYSELVYQFIQDG